MWSNRSFFIFGNSKLQNKFIPLTYYIKNMKNIIFVLVYLLSFNSFGQGNNAVKDITKFQKKLNKDFTNTQKSPLTDEDLKEFKSLDFFPIDTSYRVTAKLKYYKGSKPFKMKTTTDRLPVYRIFASATFEIHGKKHVLHIYQNQKLLLSTEFEDYLFLPFTDKTNGINSYGGGRYIDLKVTDKETIIIDFNKAYNPSCAYNDKYSCPIPPKSNQLDIEIPAGVKTFEAH